MYPILFKIGSFKVDSYFTIISFAIIVGIFFSLYRAKNKINDINPFFDTLIVLILSSYVGARLFHVLFELPDFYYKNPIEIFKIWKGGFVVFGAFVFGAIGSIIFMIIKKLPMLLYADVISAPLMLVMGIGRQACFLTGCCFGKPTSSWIGVKFPLGSAAPAGIHLHPTQLYMSFSALLIMIIILLIEKKYKNLFPGFSFSMLAILFPISRFIIEFFRNDYRGGTFLGLSVSQNTSILFIASGVLIIVFQLLKKRSQ